MTRQSRVTPDSPVACGEAGTATLVLPLLVGVAVIAAIALVDVAGYLVAAARAQQLADAAALAAVSVDVPGSHGSAAGAAERVVTTGGGRLEQCACTTGSEAAEVAVSLPVPGLHVPSFGAQRVTARAAAELAEPPPADRPRATAGRVPR